LLPGALNFNRVTISTGIVVSVIKSRIPGSRSLEEETQTRGINIPGSIHRGRAKSGAGTALGGPTEWLFLGGQDRLWGGARDGVCAYPRVAPAGRAVQGLLANKDTHRPWGGPMPLGTALP